MVRAQRRLRDRQRALGERLGIGVAALGGLAIGTVANYMGAQAAVAISISLGLLLLVPVMVFSPLVRHPTAPPPID